MIEEKLPLIEEILGNWKSVIGENFEGYKNFHESTASGSEPTVRRVSKNLDENRFILMF